MTASRDLVSPLLGPVQTAGERAARAEAEERLARFCRDAMCLCSGGKHIMCATGKDRDQGTRDALLSLGGIGGARESKPKATPRRAKAGGEFGRNGEFYEGGEFLPSTRAPKRGVAKRNGTRRVLVMPGMVATIPEGRVAVFPRIREFVTFETGKGAVPKFADDHPAVAVHFESPAEMHRLIAAFNGGVLHEAVSEIGGAK